MNILIPFRAGDVLRLLLFSKKKLGFVISAYFVAVERVIDLFIANTIFFVFGYFRDDLEFSIVNYFGWITGTLGLMLLLAGTRYKRYSLCFRGLFAPLGKFRLVFPRKELTLFSLSLAGSWAFTSLAFLILGERYDGLVQDWVSLNTNFSDPLSLALSVYNILFLALFIPLIFAYLYSLSIPSPSKISRITLQEFLGDKRLIKELVPFKSRYAGSGSDFFLATAIDLASKHQSKYLIRVESSRASGNDSNVFLDQALPQYKFPSVFHTKVFMNASCTIMEFIVDGESDRPSRNAFEQMSTDRDSLIVLDEVINHIIEFHLVDNRSLKERVEEELIESIKSRIIRVDAFVSLTLNHFNSEDRQRMSRFQEITRNLVLDTDRFASKFTKGYCHGDASLSNFLVQEFAGQRVIRSIDPNTRFPISNIEFDLAKVMQSTHALYEFSLGAPHEFPNNKIDLLRFQQQLGWSSHLIDNLSDEAKFPNLDFELLRYFLFLHLIRIVPYKVRSGQDSLRQFLNLIDWVDDIVDF